MTTIMSNLMSSAEDPFRYYVELAQYYILPLLIVFGILGNTLSGYVILRTKLRTLSSSHYLLALATVDSIILLTIGVQWLKVNDVDLQNHALLCETITYIGDLAGTVSVWLIVEFTAERFIVVQYPLHSKVLCTVSRSQFIIVILVLAMALIYSPVIFIAGMEFSELANRTICGPRVSWHKVGLVFNTFDLIFTCFLPVCIITILNAVISRKVWSFSKLRRTMTDTFEMDHLNEVSQSVMKHVKFKTKSTHTMTKMLLIVSTVSMCMITPSYLMRFVFHLANLNLVTIRHPHALITLQLYVQFLYYLTIGMNFVLYCISGQNFRRAVISALFCEHNRLHRHFTITNTDNRTQSSGMFSSQTTLKQRLQATSQM